MLKICMDIKETVMQSSVYVSAVLRGTLQPLGLQLGLDAVPFTQYLMRQKCQPQGGVRNRLIMLTN